MSGVVFIGLQLANRDAKSLADVDANISLARRAIEEDETTNADSDERVFVLGEMYTTGYSEDVWPHIHELAEEREGKSFHEFSEIAKHHNCYIVYGFPRIADPEAWEEVVQEDVETNAEPEAVAGKGSSVLSVGSDYVVISPQNSTSPKSLPSSPRPASPRPPMSEQQQRRYTGRLMICQNVVGPTGHLVASYDKMHVCDFGVCAESRFFSPGAFQPCTFVAGKVKVGLMICYDFRFPELARHLAYVEGCDVILHPVAFPKDGCELTFPSFLLTRAVENQVYVLTVNRAGDFFGSSTLTPPEIGGGKATGRQRQLGDEPGRLELRPSTQLLQRIRSEFSFRKDLHPALDGHERKNSLVSSVSHAPGGPALEPNAMRERATIKLVKQVDLELAGAANEGDQDSFPSASSKWWFVLMFLSGMAIGRRSI